MKFMSAAIFCLLALAQPARADLVSDYTAYLERNDYGGAWAFILRNAKQGNSQAQFFVGNQYYWGSSEFMSYAKKVGISEDKAEACRWYLKSANGGFGSGILRAGGCYEEGHIGAAKDYDKAALWYRKAYDNGDGYGAANLGRLYRDVFGDLAKAREWFSAAASRTYGVANYELGLMHEEGKGGPKDIAEARRLYAQSDDYKAKYRLGLMYEEGRGVAKDIAKAIEYYAEAENDDEVGNDAQSRIKALKNHVAEAKNRAEQARLEEERRKVEAERQAAEERRRANEKAEKERIVRLSQGLRRVSMYRKVAAANANIRALPERAAPAGRRLQLGEQVHVVGILSSGWVQVAEEGVPVGWVHEAALERTTATPAPPVAAAGAAAPEPELIPIDAPY